MPLIPEQIIADLRERAERCESFSDCQGVYGHMAQLHYRLMASYLLEIANHYERGELMTKEA